MISGGNTTIYVSNMDAAIRFYTQSLGLKLTNRFGDHWATVEAGPSYWTSDEVMAGLVIGLHPQSPKYPPPGTKGSVMFGLETYEPIDNIFARLVQRGVRTKGDIIRNTEIGNFLSIEDLDGNDFYIWEITPNMLEGVDDGPAGPGISGGHANIYISNMDAAVRFYTEVLGLRLTNRFDNHWATVEAGNTLVLGLHPESPKFPPPGTKGSMMLGLSVDEPIERVVARLAKLGVRLTSEIVRAAGGSFAGIEDMDGNAIYLWEDVPKPSPENAETHSLKS